MSDLRRLLQGDPELRPLDKGLAQIVSRWRPELGPWLSMAAAQVSLALGQGHTALSVQQLSEPPAAWTGPEWPTEAEWSTLLSQLPSTPEGVPLCFVQGFVSLGKYGSHERALALSFVERATRPRLPVDEERLEDSMVRLFPPQWRNPEQEAAVRRSAGASLSIISGGPGTGKTSTVVRVLAVILEQALLQGAPPPKIMLLAPTGKAASRLSESIIQQKSHLAAHEEVLKAMPEVASTIHRALGTKGGDITRFVHDKRHPMDCDLVLVDEVSMVDVPLFRRLMDALPNHARVILLGDADQLPSVGVGSVLGTLAALEETNPVGRCVHFLRVSKRFDAGGGIGRLAKGALAGAVGEASAVLEGASDEVRYLPSRASSLRDEEALNRAIDVAFARYARARTPGEWLEALGDARILCAVRQGPSGVEELNRHVERRLRHALQIPWNDPWYSGRPVMVTKNDYETGLYNGDIGVVGRGEDGVAVVYFEDPQGGLRQVPTSRLPAHETVFATTVHKSQGSEFQHVFLVIPDGPTRVWSRALVYTAITRAKKRLTIFGDLHTFYHGISSVERRETALHVWIGAAE